MLEIVALCLFPGLMLFAGSMDLFTMTIPNKISIALLVGFLIFAPLTGMGLADIGWHLACGGIALVITVGMFAMGWLGGGDAKVFSAAAVWFGFSYTVPFLAVTAVAGGVLSLGIVLFRTIPLPQILVRQEWLARLHDPKGYVPYGIAIAAGALIVYPETSWVLGSVA